MKFLGRVALAAGLAAGFLVGLATQNLRADNWGHWRGPFFNGSTAETNLPVSWSTNENIAWAATLPGFSGATPIVWGERVFVSSPDADKNLLLICLGRKDGKFLWQKTV